MADATLTHVRDHSSNWVLPHPPPKIQTHQCHSPGFARLPCSSLSTQGFASQNMPEGASERSRLGEAPPQGEVGGMSWDPLLLPPCLPAESGAPRGASRGMGDRYQHDHRSTGMGHHETKPWIGFVASASLLKKKRRKEGRKGIPAS